MIAIVDYGLGNLGSVANLCRHLQVAAQVSSEPAAIRAADALILPGVGAFDAGMSNLESRGLLPVLREAHERGTPVLGICLGMQLLAEGSEEGTLPGLGWIPGQVRRFELAGLPVPHMGWREVEAQDGELFADLCEEARFYFVHSYHFVCREKEHVAAWADYGGRFTAAVRSNNICGTQFHPEKSHRYGMQLMRNFATLVGRG